MFSVRIFLPSVIQLSAHRTRMPQPAMLEPRRLRHCPAEISVSLSASHCENRSFRLRSPAHSIVLRISPRPCSESNGASVANKHFPVPKKAWPQRVGAISPSAVSA